MLCLLGLLLSFTFQSCGTDDNTPKSYKIYWDITNYSYPPSQEIDDLLAAFDAEIVKGSYCDSVSNHTFYVKEIKYSEYKKVKEETLANADAADAWLKANWSPSKRYRVRVYCYCPDDYDYYSVSASSGTEVWKTYTYKKD